MASYNSAAAKYRPDRVRVLFVAESPPVPKYGEPARYFYFENVKKADHLWSGLMKALYADFKGAKNERERKAEWLDRFKRDGYWLIDAVKTPIAKKTADGKQIKRKALRTHLSKVGGALIKEIRAVHPGKVVLISSPVWEVLHRPLKEAGLPVVNFEALFFPGSGQQGEFQKQFAKLDRRVGLRPQLSLGEAVELREARV